MKKNVFMMLAIGSVLAFSSCAKQEMEVAPSAQGATARQAESTSYVITDFTRTNGLDVDLSKALSGGGNIIVIWPGLRTDGGRTVGAGVVTHILERQLDGQLIDHDVTIIDSKRQGGGRTVGAGVVITILERRLDDGQPLVEVARKEFEREGILQIVILDSQNKVLLEGEGRLESL